MFLQLYYLTESEQVTFYLHKQKWEARAGNSPELQEKGPVPSQTGDSLKTLLVFLPVLGAL